MKKTRRHQGIVVSGCDYQYEGTYSFDTLEELVAFGNGLSLGSSLAGSEAWLYTKIDLLHENPNPKIIALIKKYLEEPNENS